jgi:hypothetical protein
MTDYLRRLEAHPGVPVASLLTVMATLVTFGTDTPWYGGTAIRLTAWIPVLITARTQPLPEDEHD